MYFPKSFFISLGIRFVRGFLITHLLPVKLLCRSFFRIDNIVSYLTVTEFYNSVCHIFNSIIVSHKYNGVTILFIYIFNQLENFF